MSLLSYLGEEFFSLIQGYSALEWSNLGFGYYSNECFERGYFRGVGWSRVESVLRQWHPPCPIILLLITEYAEVGFESLVCSFRLSISLGMISHTDVLVYPCFIADFFGQF